MFPDLAATRYSYSVSGAYVKALLIVIFTNLSIIMFPKSCNQGSWLQSFFIYTFWMRNKLAARPTWGPIYDQTLGSN